MKKFYFMSGLPRSGSTLLTSILNQNPEIYSSTNSPLLHLITTTSIELLNSEQYKAFPKPTSLFKVISEIPNNFYWDREENIIIDKSRSWPFHVDTIKYFRISTNPKIICPVRSILDILASFISLLNKNDKVSYIDQALIDSGLDITTENRCEWLMSKGGSVGEYYRILQSAIFRGYEKNLLFVEYDDILNNPQKTLNTIYDFLEIDRYNHDLNHIRQDEVESDAEYGIEGMHTVRPQIKGVSRNISDYLDQNTIKKYSNLEFWRKQSTINVFGLG